MELHLRNEKESTFAKQFSIILRIKLNKYHHFIINQEKIDQLKFYAKNIKFHLIDTKQFTKSYELMRKLIKDYE